MKILTVDDDEIALELLNMTLEQSGHQPCGVTSAVEATELLQDGEFRIVITDWEMPEISGLDLCKRIRELDLPHYVYAIVLTSHDEPEEIVQGLAAGADDFVTKPFNPAEMEARIRIGARVLALETRDVAIFAMAKLAESRDAETGKHIERVQVYCRILAQGLLNKKLPGYEADASLVQLITKTSPLHDLGKVGIPDSILLKPGRLNDREFEVMKSHTTLGAETLEAALRQFPEASFLLMARDIALTHHERYDGTGYPNGLAGDNIPLSGRIVAVADVYDALTTKRVYKNGFSHEIARAIIEEEAGSQFDPVLVDIFLESEEQFLEVHERFGVSVAA